MALLLEKSVSLGVRSASRCVIGQLIFPPRPLHLLCAPQWLMSGDLWLPVDKQQACSTVASYVHDRVLVVMGPRAGLIGHNSLLLAADFRNLSFGPTALTHTDWAV
jgi:hypothetical protein